MPLPSQLDRHARHAAWPSLASDHVQNPDTLHKVLKKHARHKKRTRVVSVHDLESMKTAIKKMGTLIYKTPTEAHWITGYNDETKQATGSKPIAYDALFTSGTTLYGLVQNVKSDADSDTIVWNSNSISCMVLIGIVLLTLITFLFRARSLEYKYLDMKKQHAETKV